MYQFDLLTAQESGNIAFQVLVEKK